MTKRTPSHSGYNATCVQLSARVGNLGFRILSRIEIGTEAMRIEVVGNVMRRSRRMLLRMMMRRRSRLAKPLLVQFRMPGQNGHDDTLDFLPRRAGTNDVDEVLRGRVVGISNDIEELLRKLGQVG